MVLALLVTLILNNAMAQTLETIMDQQRQFEKSPQIRMGNQPSTPHIRGTVFEPDISEFDIDVNAITNKIYMTHYQSNTVSVLDSNTGAPPKNIRVGIAPTDLAVNEQTNKIYVVNHGSNTVSVIDGYNDTEIATVHVGAGPSSILIDISNNKIYVSNRDDNTVSVIDGFSNKARKILVGSYPTSLAIDFQFNESNPGKPDTENLRPKHWFPFWI